MCKHKKKCTACSAGISKKTKMARKRKVSLKSAQTRLMNNAEEIIGGGVALGVNPVVSDFLREQGSYISGGVKVLAGAIALALGNDYADGFGITMAAFGAGEVVNKAYVDLLDGTPIPGLPTPTARMNGLPRVNQAVRRTGGAGYYTRRVPAGNGTGQGLMFKAA